MEKSKVRTLIQTYMSAKNISKIIEIKGLLNPLKLAGEKREELVKAIDSIDATVINEYGISPIILFYHLKSNNFEFEGDMSFFNELSFEDFVKMVSNGIEFEEKVENEVAKLEEGDFVKINGKEYGIFEAYVGVDDSVSHVFTVGGSEIVRSEYLAKVVDENEKIIATILVEAELGSNIEVYNEDGSCKEVKIIMLEDNLVLMNNETFKIIRATATKTMYNIASFIAKAYRPSKVVVC